MKWFPIINILSVCLLVGCDKSYEQFDSGPGTTTDTVWVASNSSNLPINQLHELLMPAAQADSFVFQAGADFTFAGGVRLVVPPSAFTSNSTVVSGTGQVSLHLLRKKGDFIRFRKSTVNNAQLLQVGHAVYLNITKGGQVLELLPAKTLSLSFTDSQPSTINQSFYGIAPSSPFGSYNWLVNDSGSLSPMANGYTATTHRQQWLAFGSIIDSASARSRSIVGMPARFTNANTSTFIIFNNTNSIMQMVPDAINRIWLSENVPTGKTVTYLTLSKLGTEYWLGLAATTTAINQVLSITPQKSSLTEIGNYLNSL
jgi:hypothetical protein